MPHVCSYIYFFLQHLYIQLYIQLHVAVVHDYNQKSSNKVIVQLEELSIRPEQHHDDVSCRNTYAIR
jgi:hypothetical protein